MKKRLYRLSFYIVEFMDGRKIRYTNLVLPLLMMNTNVKTIVSARTNEIIWDCSMREFYKNR